MQTVISDQKLRSPSTKSRLSFGNLIARAAFNLFTLKREDKMDEQHVKGEAKKAEGKAKEVIGEALDDSSMKAKGKADQAEGEARKTAGDVKDAVS
jgi:uncharacterized protein YjbJ (UPF0337 family)